MFEVIGLEIKKISARYKISKLPVPEDMKRLHPIGIDYHLTVLVKINSKWNLVDATADPPLEKAGFIVNHWDGLSETAWFIEPEMTTYDGKGNKKKFRKKRDEWLKKVKRSKEGLNDFKISFNQYLEKFRGSGDK